MTTYLGNSCSFGLLRVPFVNCRQFMYLVISLLVLRAGCGIWLYQFLIIAYHLTLMVPICIHSRSLPFEGNASLKCVYSGLTPLSIVFQSYHDSVLLLQWAQCGLGGSHFYTYNSGFPCVFICLSFMLMAVDFSRSQKGYSVHVFSLYYIVIDLEAGQYFVGRFQNLDYMHY